MAINLPNEITLHILEFVSPDDLVNVALTCSSVYHLATDRLKEHREFREKYKEGIVLGSGDSNFLMKAYHNPRIWHYVKDLDYEPYTDGYDNHVDSVYLDMVEFLLDSSPYMKYGDHLVTSGKEVIADMKSGSSNYAYGSWTGMFLALLLAYLPNVTVLRLCIDHPCPELQLYKSMIKTIVRANGQNPDLRALRGLSMIDIYEPPDTLVLIHKTINMDWLTPLLFLPSLRTCHISMAYIPEPVEQPVGEQSSPVEEVNAVYSDIHRPQFLSVLTNLRKLVYHYLELEEFQRGDEHVDILAYLERYYSGTLEELEFSASELPLEMMYSALGSFREFKKLKKLKFPAPWVFDLEENDDEIEEYQEIIRREALGLGCVFGPIGVRYQLKGVPRLIDILPPSIEIVDIDMKRYWKTAVLFFEGLAELGRERLPTLKSIIFRGEYRSMDNMMNHLKAIGASVGIKVENLPAF